MIIKVYEVREHNKKRLTLGNKALTVARRKMGSGARGKHCAMRNDLIQAPRPYVVLVELSTQVNVFASPENGVLQTVIP